MARTDLLQDIYASILEDPTVDPEKAAARAKYRHEYYSRMDRKRSNQLHNDVIRTSPKQRLIFLLDQLKEDEATLIRRVVFDDHTFRELGDELGVSDETIRRRYLKAVAQLRLLEKTSLH